MVTADIIRSEALKWNAQLNLSHNENRIIKLYDGGGIESPVTEYNLGTYDNLRSSLARAVSMVRSGAQATSASRTRRATSMARSSPTRTVCLSQAMRRSSVTSSLTSWLV